MSRRFTPFHAVLMVLAFIGIGLIGILTSWKQQQWEQQIPVVAPVPAAAPTPEPPPDKTTVNVRYDYCIGISDYSKVAGEMRGTFTANQENLGYRLEGKSGYNSLPTQSTEFKILPPSGNGDHFPRYIAFGQRVGGLRPEAGGYLAGDRAGRSARLVHDRQLWLQRQVHCRR